MVENNHQVCVKFILYIVLIINSIQLEFQGLLTNVYLRTGANSNRGNESHSEFQRDLWNTNSKHSSAVTSISSFSFSLPTSKVTLPCVSSTSCEVPVCNKILSDGVNSNKRDHIMANNTNAEDILIKRENELEVAKRSIIKLIDSIGTLTVSSSDDDELTDISDTKIESEILQNDPFFAKKYNYQTNVNILSLFSRNYYFDSSFSDPMIYFLCLD